jgi:hypothetical protein
MNLCYSVKCMPRLYCADQNSEDKYLTVTIDGPLAKTLLLRNFYRVYGSDPSDKRSAILHTTCRDRGRRLKVRLNFLFPGLFVPLSVLARPNYTLTFSHTFPCSHSGKTNSKLSQML